jgi:hypothetical protein
MHRRRSSASANRRTFLKATGAAAVTAAVTPGAVAPAIHAADKSGSRPPVIGEGAHRYECHHGWGELPSHITWETTHGVTVDAEGLVYIKHQGLGRKPMDTIVVFEPSGRFVRSFGKEIYPGGHGIDIRKEVVGRLDARRKEGGEEFLYLCDRSHREVIKTNLKGERVWTLSYPKEAGVYKDVQGFQPTNVAFAPDGGFFVADGYGSHYIHRYDKDAKWVSTFGGPGKEAGKLQTPHGLWWDDRQGRKAALVVADRANARLHYFSADGQPGDIVKDVHFPAHFDIRGSELLVPDLHARVSILDINNHPIVHLGEDKSWREKVVASLGKGQTPIRTQPELWPAGKFVHPHDACFDKDGNIFVVEWVATGRVTFLRRVG